VLLRLRSLVQDPVRAAGPATVAELRARLEQLRAAHGKQLPDGAWLSIAYTIDVAERIAGSFAPQAALWRQRAATFLGLAEQGRDPLLEQRGKLVMRGYRSPISQHLQGYGIYLPPNYDAARKYPLLVMLHGGSANGNLFLGVVLGNNMNWKEYDLHLWDEYAPRWTPDWIVVAPDGFGQVMWRFMGEQDVLDVIADVQKHYAIDDDRIALGGLSNGGVGAYNLGMRHAHRFSIVQAIAGAPSWLQYSGKGIPAEQQQAMIPQSGMQLAENAINTDFRYYHGRVDPGPMRPAFVEELTRFIATLGVPYKETWFDTGHDLLYLVHRRGKLYAELEPLRRKQRPSEVRVVTGDYRANRQHWVTVTRIDGYPRLARVRATVQGEVIDVEASHVRALELDLKQAPLAAGTQLRVRVNGKDAYRGGRAACGAVLALSAGADGNFRRGTPPVPAAGTLEKKPGLSGPITDAYYGAMAHVYGTGDPAAIATLKRAAQRGAQGWPLWLWRVQQPVLADSEVTDAIARSHTLVLYGTPGSNSVLERIAGSLPIKVEQDAVVLGTRRISGPGVGTRFIYPSPLAPSRYVMVQAAPTAEGVTLGHNLPDFLPDYVVYDKKSAAVRPRLAFPGRKTPPAMGYFDDRWRLNASPASVSGGSSGASAAPKSTQGVPTTQPSAPALPAAPAQPSAPARPPAPTQLNRVLPAPSAATHTSVTAAAAAPAAPSAIPVKSRGAATPGAPWVVATGLPTTPATTVTIPSAAEIAAACPPPRCVPLAAPPQTRQFAASPHTQAGQAARQIARLTQVFRNYRAEIPLATWTEHPEARWSIRDNGACFRDLRAQRIAFLPYPEELTTPVPAPVEIDGRINGVRFKMLHADRTLLFSCELVARLPDIAAVLARHGVRSVGVISAYRDSPKTSFHTLGLALDISRITTDEGSFTVLEHFELTPGRPTCDAPRAATAPAQLLRDIVCDLAASLKISSVLTPNYNAGHADHIHLDLRPDDPRVYVR
jgi:hypothetical protein